MPLVQFINGTSASDSFDITLDSPPATNNSLILVIAIDSDERIAAQYQSDTFDVAVEQVNVRKGSIQFLTSITAGSSVVSITRDHAGDSLYTLIEVSGLADTATPDASNANANTGADPTVDISPVAATFIVAGFGFGAPTITAFGGDSFKSFSTVVEGSTSLDAAFKEAGDAGTYTHSATLSGSDDWLSVIASFALVPEETLLAEMVETTEAAALPATLNGFTGAEQERAFKLLDSKYKMRVRMTLMNPDLVPLYDLKEPLQEGQVSGTTDAAIKGAAQLKFLEVQRDSQHSAPLGTFAVTVAAQNRLFWLRLGETSGNFADSSGNSRTFTANGTITYSIGSLAKGDLLNNAIKPNGTSGYLSIADAVWMDVGTITLSLAWSGTGVSQTLIDRDDGGANRFWRFEVDANGLLSFAINFTTGSPTRKPFVAATKVSDGQPHLFQAVYDKAYVSLYVDGARVLHTAETRTMATGACPINVARNAAGANFSSGTFDEVGMIGRALTPRELRDEYQTWSNQLNELLFDRSRGDRVKVYYAVKMPRNGTDGTPWAEYAQGVYLLPTLSRAMDADESVIASVSCLDQTSVLNDAKFQDRYTVTAATSFITAVLAIAQLADFNTSAWAVTVTTKLVVTDIDFEVGSSYLEAINYLLQQINYKALRFNGDGAAILEPNVLDVDIPVTATFVTDEESVILVDGLSEDIELRKVPATVIAATANPDSPDIQGTASLKGGAAIIYGGGYVVKIVGDYPDQATIDAAAQQALNDAAAKAARRFKFQTYPRPIHGDRDKYHVTASEMGRDEDFIEEEWTLPLSPAPMQRSCLSVIDVR